ncbi:unnamed protein product [Clavelina lepadiformis]|uniref:Cytochrome P450 n=1 Tax=Clavelina lepadiformis TaxID=159417 RepID=A0ABP0FJU0_CLALP
MTVLNLPDVLYSPIIFMVAIISLYFVYGRRHKSNKFPPGVRGIPVVGVIPFVGKYPERKFLKWSKKHGEIMSVQMGMSDWIILNSLESINEALAKQPTKFSGRPTQPVYHQIDAGYGIILTDYGALWKSQRKFGLMTLRGFGVGKKSMEDRIREEATYLNEKIRKQGQKAFDIADLLPFAVSNIICGVVFGKQYDYDDPFFKKIVTAVLEMFGSLMINTAVTIMSFAPILMHIPPFTIANRMFAAKINTINEIVTDIIDEHEKTFGPDHPRDFIDAFLKEKRIGTPCFTNDQLMAYARHLFIAGTETTSSTLSWAILCLVHYPQIQKKLRNEILEVQGAGFGSFDRSKMPYTNAFIHELMRFRTVAPLGVPHKLSEDSEIYGYVIPKGTQVLTNLWAVHHDPSYWDDPETFNPDRFIDKKGEFVKSNHVIPFSVGPRFCLGEQLARMEVFIFLVSIVQKFEILPDPDAGKLPDINDGINGVVFTPKPYKILCKELE